MSSASEMCFVALLMLVVGEVTMAVTAAVQPNRHPACVNFTIGNEPLHQFYSPGWPRNYPSNINCTRVLEAPTGMVIHIDFRDSFDVEPEPNCRNDYLLVRDGKEAYSRVIRQVCGHKFPPIIISSGSHLWLRFSSDDSIEYKGFKAVYSFVKKAAIVHAPHCSFHLTAAESIISTENITQQAIDYSVSNGAPLDCKWRIIVGIGKEIQISFKTFNLDKPNDCQLNYVQILSGPEISLRSKELYCSSKADSVKLGINTNVTFRYYAHHSVASSPRVSVLAVVTQLRQKKSDNEKCQHDEFDCDDMYCINRTLVCNGNFNCDKQLDEKANCLSEGEENALAFLDTDANIIILIVGCGLLFGMCFSMFWNCIRKLREDCREKEESMHHSQLDMDGATATTRTGRLAGATSVDNSGCYVPSVDLKPVLMMAAGQRDGTSTRGSGHSVASVSQRVAEEFGVDAAVDTVDRGCQTPRLLLRQAPVDSVSPRHLDSRSLSSSPSPPPPPPPPGMYTRRAPYTVYPESHYQSTLARHIGSPPARFHDDNACVDYNCQPPRPRTLPKSLDHQHQQHHYHWGQRVMRPSAAKRGSRSTGMAGVSESLSAPSVDHACQTPPQSPLPALVARAGQSRVPNTRRYRAEAVIEMSARPSSIHSAKSAPDVVVKL